MTNGKLLRDLAAEERVPLVLQRAHSRFYRLSKHDEAGREVDYHNPLEELMAREEMAQAEALVDSVVLTQRMMNFEVIPPVLVCQIQEIVLEQFAQLENLLIDWIFNRAPDPLHVTKRVFAWAKQKRPDLLWNMNFRDLGDLFGETHATSHARQKALFKAEPIGWRKGAMARKKMAAAQKGNANRRGGKKARPKAVKNSSTHTNQPTK